MRKSSAYLSGASKHRHAYSCASKPCGHMNAGEWTQAARGDSLNRTTDVEGQAKTFTLMHTIQRPDRSNLGHT